MAVKNENMNQDKINRFSQVIKIMQVMLVEFEADEVDKIGDQFMDKAIRNESMMVLNPSYNLEESKLLRVNAHGLKALAKFMKMNEEARAIKISLMNYQMTKEKIEKLFEI